jgi:hypothetical protein
MSDLFRAAGAFHAAWLATLESDDDRALHFPVVRVDLDPLRSRLFLRVDGAELEPAPYELAGQDVPSDLVAAVAAFLDAAASKLTLPGLMSHLIVIVDPSAGAIGLYVVTDPGAVDRPERTRRILVCRVAPAAAAN